MAGWDQHLGTAREEIHNFHSDMESLLSDLRKQVADDMEAYRVAIPDTRTVDGEPNDYFELEPTEEGHSGVVDEFGYQAFRRDMETLLWCLEQYTTDDTRIRPFDRIAELFGEVVDLLEGAAGYDGGMNDVSIALSGWNGGAARQFKDAVVKPFGKIMTGQAKLAVELGRAAGAHQGTIIFARADVLSLTRQLQEKFDRSGGGLSLVTWLRIIGAVAAGIALTSASPWAALAWASATSSVVVSAIDELQTEEPDPDGENWKLDGKYATEFLMNAIDMIRELSSKTLDQQSSIEGGLAADRAELAQKGILGELEPARPELLDATKLSDLGTRADTDGDGSADITVSDILALKLAGVTDLPAIAEMLDDAHIKVGSVRTQFRRGLGGGLAGSTAWTPEFDAAVDLLDDALIHTRDFLYWSGQNLSTIADNYYVVEEVNAARAEELRVLVEDGVASFEDSGFETYDPNWRPPQSPGPT